MRVLLAYDGSAGAMEAVALAESIPWPSDSLLRVINVIEPIAMSVSGPWDRGTALTPELDAAITTYAQEAMREVVKRLALPASPPKALYGAAGPPARSSTPRVTFTQTWSSSARGAMEPSRRWSSGQCPARLSTTASWPVLVARNATLSQVVFATDGSPSAQAAEAMLAQWTIFAGSSIRVVSVADVVVPWTSGIAPTMYAQVLDAYAADLRQAKLDHERLAAESAARLREAGRVVQAEMRAGDAAGEIIAVAEQQGSDLIVLGSRGRTGLTRVLLGSVARNVLSGSTASVLIVRDGTQEPAEVEAELK